MKKAVTILLLVATLLFCLCSCVDKAYPLMIEGKRISEGVYAMYLSETKSADEARELCIRQTAAENLMKQTGHTLSANYKRLVAEEAGNIWSLFSAYYEKIGVTKQDITTVLTAEYNIKELIGIYYGENSNKPVSAKRLKKEFDSSYIGFRAIEASYLRLSDMGESVSLSDEEKAAVKKKFNSMAKSINNGSMTIDKANESYNESLGLIVTQPPETVLIKKGDPLYSEDFYQKASEVGVSEAAVIESGSSIYLIYRLNIADNEEYFMMYKDEMLEKLKTEDIYQKLSEESAEYEVKTNSPALREISKRVLGEK